MASGLRFWSFDSWSCWTPILSLSANSMPPIAAVASRWALAATSGPIAKMLPAVTPSSPACAIWCMSSSGSICLPSPRKRRSRVCASTRAAFWVPISPASRMMPARAGAQPRATVARSSGVTRLRATPTGPVAPTMALEARKSVTPARAPCSLPNWTAPSRFIGAITAAVSTPFPAQAAARAPAAADKNRCAREVV